MPGERQPEMEAAELMTLFEGNTKVLDRIIVEISLLVGEFLVEYLNHRSVSRRATVCPGNNWLLGCQWYQRL